jgi:metal-responsive CopG/Arc/MetJ family transcriptional regulator
LTESRTYEIGGRVGRKMEFPERITLPLAEGTTARLDSLLEGKEVRVELIRKAIAAEIKRRERETKGKP